MKRLVLAHVLVAVLLAPIVAEAQGVVAGTVSDATGRPLPGVTVTAQTRAAPQTSRRVVTDAAGRYRFGGLDRSADLTLLFTLAGFTPVSRDVELPSDAATVAVTMAVGPLDHVDVVLPPIDLPGPPLQQPDAERRCLHRTNETVEETQRRTEALMAIRLISQAVATSAGSSRPLAPFPSWTALASSPAVAALSRSPGIAGELARKIQWGSGEPLPGWRITYAATLTDVRFALTDERDPCGFTYSSADPQVVPPSDGRMVPLT